MKNQKVIFRGNKVPSGMTLDVECFITEKKLQNLQKDGRFDIEVLGSGKTAKPKAKPKKTKKGKGKSE
tara:strand:- start:1429 stop:1632 length:204 start_codon:yes stop_codon:yes gene_type:complete